MKILPWLWNKFDALLRCDFSSLVWDYWLENPLRSQGFKNSFLDSALAILSHSTLQDLEIFFATAWALRINRNRTVHKDDGLSPLQVWLMARNAVDDFACSASWDFSLIRPASSSWTPPPPGIFKVNVDGASSEQEGSSSVGVVIRDSNGQVMAALCLPLQSYFSAELTEVLLWSKVSSLLKNFSCLGLYLNLMLWQLFKQLMIKLRGAYMVTLFKEFCRFVSLLNLAISSI